MNTMLDEYHLYSEGRRDSSFKPLQLTSVTGKVTKAKHMIRFIAVEQNNTELSKRLLDRLKARHHIIKNTSLVSLVKFIKKKPVSMAVNRSIECRDGPQL